MPCFYLVNHTREIYQLYYIRVVSAVLKIGAVETCVDSAVKKFSETVSLEDQDRVLVVAKGRRCSCVVKNLETVEEVDASVAEAGWSMPRQFSRWLTGGVSQRGLGELIIVKAGFLLVNWSAADLVMQKLTRCRFRNTETSLLQVWLVASSLSPGTCKDP